MSFITYFDLLGTRGFCDDSDLYYDNLVKFNRAVCQTGSVLLSYGKVGAFSDSAYAESTKLEPLLRFLVILRNRLMADGLFFNAVVKKGELGISSLSDHMSNVFGVAFQNKEIANLYISQTKFKGIGICVDQSISSEELERAECPISDCVYIDTHGEGDYSVISYRDISLTAYDTLAKDNNKYWEIILEIFLREFFKAFVKKPKYGAYYISLFSNFIRSFGTNLVWDMKQNKFINPPVIFDVVNEMITTSYDSLEELPGLECLILLLLDTAYGSASLDTYDKDSITKYYIGVDCVRSKYLHNLESLPQNVFHCTSNENFRDRFIRYCQKDLTEDFVNKVFSK